MDEDRIDVAKSKIIVEKNENVYLTVNIWNDEPDEPKESEEEQA